MKNDLLELIKNKLPETQAAMVRDELNKVKALKDKVLTLTKDNKELMDKYETLEKKHFTLNNKHGVLREVHDKLKVVHENVNDKLRNADVEKAEAKLHAYETVIDKFLKNTVVREVKQHAMIEEFPQVQQSYQNGATVPVNVGVSKQVKSVVDTTEHTTE
jgi:hypothetical protein